MKLLSAPCASTSLGDLRLGPAALSFHVPLPSQALPEQAGPRLGKSLLARAWSSESVPDTVVSAFLDIVARNGVV